MGVRVIKNVKISTKIPVLILVAAILSCVIVGTMAVRVSEQTLLLSLENKLESLLAARKIALGDYLNSIRDDLAFVATNQQTIAALKEFEHGWKELIYSPSVL